MKTIIRNFGVFLIGGLLVISCGGGGGGTGATANGVTFPSCTQGSGEFSGCWVSELCGQNPTGNPLRYLAEVTEISNNPSISGTIRKYLLEYNDNTCSGTPIRITDVDAQVPGGLLQVYVMQGDVACSDTGGTQGLSCNALDITITQGVNQFEGFTTQLISNDRLCMPEIDYNFDDSGSGGIQAQNDVVRNAVVDLTPGECLNRFIP